MPIGAPEVIVILVIALIFLGPKKLPQLGRSLGTGMREFKESVSGNSKHDDDDHAELLSPADAPAAAADAPAAAAEKPAAPAEKPAAPAEKPAAKRADKPADEPAATAPRDAK